MNSSINKWYMHKPESVLENEMREIWDTNRSPNLGYKTSRVDISKKDFKKKKEPAA